MVEVGSQEVKDHYDWLEEKLKYYSQDDSTAWLAVTLHHPPFLQNGMKEFFLPILRKYKVDFIFVGHEHWAEYANMKPDYDLRFPPETPQILNNCSAEVHEILIHEERVQNFTKGGHIHQFLSGNGGHTLRKICPFKDQDGEVYFKNNGYNGISTVEVTSKKFTFTYYKGVDDIVYQINVLSE